MRSPREGRTAPVRPRSLGVSWPRLDGRRARSHPACRDRGQRGVAIDELTRRPGPTVAADLGTGSGAIALALVDEVADVEVWATDVSADALVVASSNLAGLGRPAARVRLAEGDWYGALPVELQGRLDLIVANPPYVAAGDELPAVVLDWEPRAALLAGADGLDALRVVVGEAPQWMRDDGVLVVECAPNQVDEAAGLCRDSGFASSDVIPDLAGRQRVVKARL